MLEIPSRSLTSVRRRWRRWKRSLRLQRGSVWMEENVLLRGAGR